MCKKTNVTKLCERKHILDMDQQICEEIQSL